MTTTHIHLKTAGAVLLFWATVAIFAILALGACDYISTAPEKIDKILHTCQEDESCWQCETMGNHICGPGAPRP